MDKNIKCNNSLQNDNFRTNALGQISFKTILHRDLYLINTDRSDITVFYGLNNSDLDRLHTHMKY